MPMCRALNTLHIVTILCSHFNITCPLLGGRCVFLTGFHKDKSFRPFLLLDFLKYFAGHARDRFLSKVTLDFSAAKGACNCPADTAAILTAVYSIRGSTCCSRTNAHFTTFYATLLSTAFFDFPTVLLSHLCPPLLWLFLHPNKIFGM